MSTARSTTAAARRVVATHLEIEVVQEADIAMAVAVCSGYAREAESLRVRLDGGEVTPHEIPADHGGRVHIMRSVAPGTLVV